jgi:carbon monoxide dehydrogenase subunit G
VILAPRSAVWSVVSDPYHLSRWWPRVTRVEGVQERKRGTGTVWTKVLETKAGRTVRADFRCLYSKEPSSYAWEQEVEDTAFEKVFRSAVTRIELSDADGGTRVNLETQQRLRGLSRFGGFMIKRASSTQLDHALDGLERAVGAAGQSSREQSASE